MSVLVLSEKDYIHFYSLPKLFRRHIEVDSHSGCWNWLAKLTDSGYGQYIQDHKRYFAHRFSFLTCVRPIIDGMVIDHTCGNRKCVNPSHLEEVTREENTRRSNLRNSEKTHCINGHFFDEANTYITSQYHRACRKCKYNDNNKRKAIKRANRKDDDWDWVY